MSGESSIENHSASYSDVEESDEDIVSLPVMTGATQQEMESMLQQGISIDESLNSRNDLAYQYNNDNTALSVFSSQIVEPEVVATASAGNNSYDATVVGLDVVEESLNHLYLHNETNISSLKNNTSNSHGDSSGHMSLQTSPIILHNSDTTLSPTQIDFNRDTTLPDSAPLPDGWLQYFTDDGWPYYYHTMTNVSSWDHPSLSLSYIDTSVTSSRDQEPNESYNINIPMNNVESSSMATTRNAAGQSPIHISAQECMFEGIRILLNSGIPADLPDSRGLTSLYLVCSQPFNNLQISCIQLLLDYGADINYISPSNGDSLVHSTVRHGNASVMEYLFQCGAIVSHTNNDGDTPLHLAAKIAQFQCMQSLVLLTEKKTGTPPMNRSRSNSNATSMSSKSDGTNAWRAYEQAKASGSFDAKMSSGNPFEIVRKHSKTVKHTKKYRSNDSASDAHSVNSTEMYVAQQQSQTNKVADEWVEYYTADGNVYYYNERTQKVQWENPGTSDSAYRVIQHTNSTLLADNGGSDDESSYHTKTSIDWALRDQHKHKYNPTSQQPTLLKETGGMRTYMMSNSSIQRNTAVITEAPYQAKVQYQTPPSKSANPAPNNIEPVKMNEMLTRSQSEDTISDLSDDNASVATGNMKEKHLKVWNRFFENAFKMGSGSTGKRVLPYNFNFDVAYANDVWPDPLPDTDYRKLLALVVAEDPVSMTDFVVDQPRVSEALISCIVREDYAYIERILLMGQYSSGVDENIRSPVHYVCKNGNLEILALLYDHAADLEAEDMYGRTPLHIASYYRNHNIVSFLLECAVNVNAEDVGGNSALHICARIGNIDGCRSLLRYGASPSAANKLGLDVLSTVKAFLTPSENTREVEQLLLAHCEMMSTATAPKSTKRDKIVYNLLNKAKDVQKDEKMKSSVKRSGKGPSSDHVDSSNSGSGKGPSSDRDVDSSNSGSGKGPSSDRDVDSSNSGKLVSSGKSLPWENLSVNTALQPPPPMTTTSANTNNTTSNSRQGIKMSETAELDDYEDDDDEDDVPSSVTDAMWGVASSLIDVTLSMFSRGGEKKSTNNPQVNRGYALPQKSSKPRSSGAATTAATTAWATTHVPPTDNELKARGLGFHPPAFIAEELNAQVEAIRTGQTPRRVNPNPPVEVTLIVEHAKREAERIKCSPLAASTSKNSDPNHPKPKPMFENSELLPPPPANGYSMGKMQSGVSWRYVDVLADRQILNNQN